MIETLPFIAATFIILWLATLLIYLRTSAGQERLSADIEALQRRLDQEGDNDNA